MTFRDLPDDWQKVGRGQRYGQSGALGRRPQPVDCAIRRPGPLLWLVEREAHAEHPWPLLPAIEQRAALRAIEGEVPQNREPVGVLAGGLDRQLIGIGIPAWWMDHGRIDARCIHLFQQIVLCEAGDLAVGRIGGEAFAPDMDLCIDDQHEVLLPCLLFALGSRRVCKRSGTISGVPTMPLSRRAGGVASFFHRPSSVTSDTPVSIPARRRWGQVNLVLLTGSWRMRLPVAANRALQSAGTVGGTPGSPTPVGKSWLGRRCTCVS